MKIFQTSGSYHIVEYKNKRYVLDNTTIEPKKYYWGQPIDELSVKMYEISKTDTRFNIKKSSLGRSTIVVVIQPFVHLLNNFLDSIFKNVNMQERIFLKFAMFVLSVIIGYFIYRVLFRAKKYDIQDKLGNVPSVEVRFSTDGRKQYGLSIVFLILLLASFLWYFLSNISGILILSGLFSLAIFVFSWQILPIGISYQRGHLFVKEVIEQD